MLVNGKLRSEMDLRRYEKCSDCMLHLPLCMCSEIAPIDNHLAIDLIVHRREWKKSSNSARLAVNLLKNCQLTIYGNQGQELNWTKLAPEKSGTYILFPAGPELTTDSPIIPSIKRVIVPDGNWGQARRIALKAHHKTGLPFLSLGFNSMSRYRLRSHPTPEYICTFEAIARLFELCESQVISQKMLEHFDTFVGRTLLSRGW